MKTFLFSFLSCFCVCYLLFLFVGRMVSGVVNLEMVVIFDNG